MAKHVIYFSEEELELLSKIFFDYKDYHRNNDDAVLDVMKLERNLTIQTKGFYQADTTYDIKQH